MHKPTVVSIKQQLYFVEVERTTSN